MLALFLSTFREGISDCLDFTSSSYLSRALRNLAVSDGWNGRRLGADIGPNRKPDAFSLSLLEIEMVDGWLCCLAWDQVCGGIRIWSFTVATEVVYFVHKSDFTRLISHQRLSDPCWLG